MMDVKSALKFAEGPNGGLPPGKEDEEIDLIIAHWSLWGPRGSGLYETTRELIQAEMEIPGVLPGMCLVPNQNAPQTVKEAHIMGHYKDALHPELNPQNWGWAYKHADVHVIHFSFDKKLSDLEPKVFFAHGTPEACLGASMRPGDDSNSFEAGADWVDKFKATIVTSERAKQFWSVFDHEGGGKIHKVNKGIDLDWWQKGNTMKTLDGEPSILYGDVWRDIKHPALLFYAANEIFKEHPKMRLNMWGLAQNMALWNDFIDRSGFRRFIGQFPIGGLTDYPEHYYNRGDVLVSPVTMGDLSRVHQEAMACFPDEALVKTSRGEKPIEEIELGELVQTHTGTMQPVVKLHRRLFRGKLIQVRTGDSLITPTPNHPILTSNGWLNAGDIQSSHMGLYCWSDRWGGLSGSQNNEAIPTLQFLRSTQRRTTSTRFPRYGISSRSDGGDRPKRHTYPSSTMVEKNIRRIPNAQTQTPRAFLGDPWKEKRSGFFDSNMA